MKTLSAIISLLLLITLQNCNAGLKHDLFGKWTGIEKTNNNGENVRSTVNTVFEPYQEHGFIAKSTLRTPGQPVGRRTLRCYQSGKVEGALTKGGLTVEVVTGTWKINDNTLTIQVDVAKLSGDYKRTIRTILVSPRKTSAIITQSNGLRGIGTMRKK